MQEDERAYLAGYRQAVKDCLIHKKEFWEMNLGAFGAAADTFPYAAGYKQGVEDSKHDADLEHRSMQEGISI